MKTKAKIGIVVLTVVMLISGLVIGVGAAGNLLHGSTGRIEIDQNDDGKPEAVFDAQDLNDLDMAITTGKTKVAAAVNSYSNTNIGDFPTFSDIELGINNLTSIPADTYYYDKETGTDDANTIKRYKKVGTDYFECDGSGKLVDETADSVTTENLVAYTGITNGNLSVGFAGYIDKSLVLGNGEDILAFKRSNENCVYNISSLGTMTGTSSSYTFQYNITLLAKTYGFNICDLTVGNFICGYSPSGYSVGTDRSYVSSATTWGSGSQGVMNISYDSSKGILTISGVYEESRFWSSDSGNAQAYRILSNSDIVVIITPYNIVNI